MGWPIDEIIALMIQSPLCDCVHQLWSNYVTHEPFTPPPNSFSLQNKRKEGNEGYVALYREGQSKACWDKNEFIRKLEYERI